VFSIVPRPDGLFHHHGRYGFDILDESFMIHPNRMGRKDLSDQRRSFPLREIPNLALDIVDESLVRIQIQLPVDFKQGIADGGASRDERDILISLDS
jgi:hypothetical protein